MSGFTRKIQRNRIKQAIQRQGGKRTSPLSKYRFKTREEMLKEQSDKIVEQMTENIKI